MEYIHLFLERELLMDKDIHTIIREVMQVRYRGRKVQPFTSPGTIGRNTFAELFRLLGFKKGAEIGVQKGKFAEVLCKGIPDLHLIGVDPWMKYNNIKQSVHDARYAETLERLAPYNVTIIRNLSVEASNDVENGSLDFINIDANHAFNYVMLDMLYWIPKVRSGGIILLHDYHDTQVRMAIDGYTSATALTPGIRRKKNK